MRDSDSDANLLNKSVESLSLGAITITPKKNLVPGHDAIRRPTKTILYPHSKNDHRFHGKGSFEKTHIGYTKAEKMAKSRNKRLSA